MRPMRKVKREMDAEFAYEVLDKAPYVTISMTRTDGTPYGIPMSVVRVDNDKFYFHCAPDGEKLDCIKNCPTVSLSAVTRCSPKYDSLKEDFTMLFSSAIAIGKAEVVSSREEKILALRALCERFLPKSMEHFDKAIKRSLDRTTVVRITLTEPPVGKRKMLGPDGKEVHGNAHPEI